MNIFVQKKINLNLLKNFVTKETIAFSINAPGNLMKRQLICFKVDFIITMPQIFHQKEDPVTILGEF